MLITDISTYSRLIFHLFHLDSGNGQLKPITTVMGIKVIDNRHVNVLNPSEWGKLLLIKDKYYIVIDTSRTLEEQRFTIAHELGHFFLGHLFFLNEIPPEQYRDLEDQADLFATTLLSQRNVSP